MMMSDILNDKETASEDADALNSSRRTGKNIRWNDDNEIIFLELITQHQAHRKTNKKREFKWNDLANDLFMHPNFQEYDRGNSTSLQRKFQRMRTSFFQKYSSNNTNVEFPPKSNRKDVLLYQLLYETSDKPYDMSYDDVDAGDDDSEINDKSRMDTSGGTPGGLISPNGRIVSANNNSSGSHMNQVDLTGLPSVRRDTFSGFKRRRDSDVEASAEKERRRMELEEKVALIHAEGEARQKCLQLENDNLRLQKEVEQAKADRAKAETTLHLTEMLRNMQALLPPTQGNYLSNNSSNNNNSGMSAR
jgi:hypothetical protein